GPLAATRPRLGRHDQPPGEPGDRVGAPEAPGMTTDVHLEVDVRHSVGDELAVDALVLVEEEVVVRTDVEGEPRGVPPAREALAQERDLPGEVRPMVRRRRSEVE